MLPRLRKTGLMGLGCLSKLVFAAHNYVFAGPDRKFQIVGRLDFLLTLTRFDSGYSQMSDDLLLKAERRSKVGTVDSQRLRGVGRVPANIYGLGKPVISASVSNDAVEKLVATLSSVVDVELDGVVDKAVVQELQWDVFSTKVLHLDLRRVDPTGRATVDVALELRGDAVGLKDGGAVRQLAKTVRIDCPDFRIPKSITVRMGALQVGDAVKASDLQLPDYAKLVTPADEVLVELYDSRKAVV